MISRLLEFLFSLQHVRITPNTRFTFVWNYPVLIVLGAIALAAIGYTFYFRQSASPNKRRAMGVVRALLLVVVFLLVWRPQLVMEHEERTRSVVAVWVDSSASMTLEDPYTGAPAEMRDFLRRVGAPVTPPPAPSATGPAANPPARATRYQVAAAALEQEREEAYILERVRAGAGIDGLYPMNAENRAAYRSATEEN